jgi:hypothetical protein
MFSIRSIWSMAMAGLVVSGCTRTNVVHPSPLNRTPIVVDGAMQIRDFEQSAARYPSGAAVAGPTEFNYEPKHNEPEWTYYYADYGTWGLNMVLLPVYLIVTPQWNEVTYPGEVVQTTYTGQPPLPPQRTLAYVPKGIRPPATVPTPPPIAGLTHPVTTSITTRAIPVPTPRSTTRIAPTTRPLTTRPAMR